MTDDFEQQDRQRLLENYEVFEKNEKGELTGKVNCGRLAKILLEADGRKYLVTRDNQEIFSYNGSYYESCGEAILKERVQYYLDDIHGLEYIKKEVCGFVKNHAYVDRAQLNPPLNLINLKNGIYDLDTGKLLSHSPQYYFLQEIPVRFNKKAKIKKIKKFLEDALNQEDIPILQEFFGDCLQREYRYKKALMCVGETDTGKSQLLALLGKLLGKDNISSKPLDLLCHDKFSAIDLYGKLANIRAELGIVPLRSIDKFLMLTGGDTIGAERKFQQSFNFRNYAKLIFSCNKIPESENKNPAYYNRWLVIEFANQISKDEQIPNFFDLISTDGELSGLFNWAITGLKRLMEKNHYSDHRSIIEIKEFMERGANPILDFINTYIEPDRTGEIAKETLYKCYLEFSKKMGYPTKDSNVFSRKFKPLAPIGLDEGQSRIKGHKRVWRGIKCTWVLEGQQEKLKCLLSE